MSMRIAKERSVWAEVKITSYSFFVLTLKLIYTIRITLFLSISFFLQPSLLYPSIFAFHHPCLLPKWTFFSFKTSRMGIPCMQITNTGALVCTTNTHQIQWCTVCTSCWYGFNDFPGASIKSPLTLQIIALLSKCANICLCVCVFTLNGPYRTLF